MFPVCFCLSLCFPGGESTESEGVAILFCRRVIRVAFGGG